MLRIASWRALFFGGLLASCNVLATEPLSASHSATVFGPTNMLLAQGSDALQLGRYEEGVRLTLKGLEEANNPQDAAAGHSNACAGYAALKRFEEALEHCNRALELDRSNWRTFNNRAAVFVGLKKLDLAMTDVNTGLELAPRSTILLKSKEVVIQHRNAANRERWRKPNKA